MIRFDFSTEERLRLDEFLREKLPDAIKNSDKMKGGAAAGGTIFEGAVSNSKIRRLIISGAVFVNGRAVVRPAFELRGKSRVVVEFEPEKFFFEKQPDDISYDVRDEDVLFEDEYLVILNKPCHFPTEKTIVGEEKRDNLHAALVRYLWKKNPSLRNPPYAGIMHRLDRDTSGVILFTKQRTVNKAIQEMFESHSFTKIYSVLCTPSIGRGAGARSGQPGRSFQPGESTVIEGFMHRESSKTQAAKWAFSAAKGGKNDALYSKTKFTLLENFVFEGKKCSCFKAELFTGRTHQIRVHLSYLGFPVLGDVLYGGESARRIFLHSERLEFLHPVTHEKISVYAKPEWR